MPLFVVLVNWTDQGLKNMKGTPIRVENVHRIAAEVGGKVQIYYTLGQYDTVSILDVPDDKALIKYLSYIGSQGNARTKTLKAWTEDEAAKLLADLTEDKTSKILTEIEK